MLTLMFDEKLAQILFQIPKSFQAEHFWLKSCFVIFLWVNAVSSIYNILLGMSNKYANNMKNRKIMPRRESVS